MFLMPSPRTRKHMASLFRPRPVRFGLRVRLASERQSKEKTVSGRSKPSRSGRIVRRSCRVFANGREETP
jgi:hypothetical protein